jgi:hypothetical protein
MYPASYAPCRHTPTVCFNRPMASITDNRAGRLDLEPFWPSRQEYHFDRWCCRAIPARTRVPR